MARSFEQSKSDESERNERFRQQEGTRPRFGAEDLPDCMVSDQFDCERCVFVEPARCDFRVDFSYLSLRRRGLFSDRRSPKPGLEALAYTVLREADRSLDYREIAERVSEARAEEASPVALQNTLRSAPELFLDCGQSRFRAISSVLDFARDTDNLWYRLPPFAGATVDRSFHEGRRVRIGQFAAELDADSTIGDVLRAIPGTRWRELPDLRDIGRARTSLASDRLARGGLDLVEQWSRLQPRPSLDEVVDRDSLVRAGSAAHHRMVESNLRLVGKIARGVVGRGVDYVDLCQHGVLGLMRAVAKFDPDLGWKFSTYATWWVRQAMRRAVADEGRLIRVAVHKFEASPWLYREHIPHGVPENELPSLRPIASLESLRESALPRVDWTAASDQVFDRGQIHLAFKSLTEREREVVEKRFGLVDGRARTLEDIGRDYGVTRERIRQIEAKGLKKLRHPSRKLRFLVETDAPHRRRKRGRSYGPLITALSINERQVLSLLYPAEGVDRPSHVDVAEALGVEATEVFEVAQAALRRMSMEIRVELSAWRLGAADAPLPSRLAFVLYNRKPSEPSAKARQTAAVNPASVASPERPHGQRIRLAVQTRFGLGAVRAKRAQPEGIRLALRTQFGPMASNHDDLARVREDVEDQPTEIRAVLVDRFGLGATPRLTTAEAAVKHGLSLVVTRLLVCRALDRAGASQSARLIERDPTLQDDITDVP